MFNLFDRNSRGHLIDGILNDVKLLPKINPLIDRGATAFLFLFLASLIVYGFVCILIGEAKSFCPTDAPALYLARRVNGISARILGLSYFFGGLIFVYLLVRPKKTRYLLPQIPKVGMGVGAVALIVFAMLLLTLPGCFFV